MILPRGASTGEGCKGLTACQNEQLCPHHMRPDPSIQADIERITMGKVTRRLIPLMFICYIVCIIDRANIGVASLTMPADLGFDKAQYGFGFGIFFLGYMIFE